MEWTDVPELINDNEFTWLPGSYDMWGPLMPGEEETKIENSSVGTKDPTTCLGHGDHCLKVESHLGYQQSEIVPLIVTIYLYFTSSLDF